MFYSAKTGGFYDRDIHGVNIPGDAVEITVAEHAALLTAQSAGKRIEADANGRPVAVDPPATPESELLERAKAEMRTMRRDMLDAVTGIGFRASVAGNDALAQETATVSQQLLDITDDPDLNSAQTYEEMRAAGVAAYRRIADSVSPGLRSAFKELEK